MGVKKDGNGGMRQRRVDALMTQSSMAIILRREQAKNNNRRMNKNRHQAKESRIIHIIVLAHCQWNDLQFVPSYCSSIQCSFI